MNLIITFAINIVNKELFDTDIIENVIKGAKDKVKGGLLIGLPVIYLIVTLGAIILKYWEI